MNTLSVLLLTKSYNKAEEKMHLVAQILICVSCAWCSHWILLHLLSPLSGYEGSWLDRLVYTHYPHIQIIANVGDSSGYICHICLGHLGFFWSYFCLHEFYVCACEYSMCKKSRGFPPSWGLGWHIPLAFARLHNRRIWRARSHLDGETGYSEWTHASVFNWGFLFEYWIWCQRCGPWGGALQRCDRNRVR